MRSVLAVLLGATLTVAAITEVWPARQDVRTDDRNADGRPDVWRRYDASGRLTSVSTDSNFDGRADVEEYYTHGALVRRESDRNLDDAIDLFEEFDVSTHQQVRSVVDTNYDGIADLLVLFRDGQPVFSQYASSRGLDLGNGTRTAARHAAPRSFAQGSSLGRLVDPFSEDVAIHGMPGFGGEGPAFVGLSTSGGLPAGLPILITADELSAPVSQLDLQHTLLSSVRPRSLRSPPLV